MKTFKQRICKTCWISFTPTNPLVPYCSPKCSPNIKKISEKKQERIKLYGTEWKLFDEIWNEREHICAVCKSYIYDKSAECFSHILSKWRYPSLRYNKKNIVLVCSETCHRIHDNGNAHRDIFLIKEILS